MRILIKPEQFKTISRLADGRGIDLGLISILDSDKDKLYYYWGEIPKFNFVVIFHNKDRPGWTAFLINENGMIVKDWTGGLD